MYNRRTWLNPLTSDSTGSVVAFEGEVTDLDSGRLYPQIYLEVADCKSKVRLHLTSDDTKEDFIRKMQLLYDEIGMFINHLSQQQ